MWNSRFKGTDIKMDCHKCARFEGNAENASTSGSFTPQPGYKPSLAYSLRIAARGNGYRSMKLLPESLDTHASTLLVAAALAVVMTSSNQLKGSTRGLPILPLITKMKNKQHAPKPTFTQLS